MSSKFMNNVIVMICVNVAQHYVKRSEANIPVVFAFLRLGVNLD